MSKISVITTVYNAQNDILNAVKSVINQSFKNFEYLIIDDGSTDNTFNLLKTIKDKRVKIHKIGKVGRAKALNFGLKKAKGDYISILDADDTFHFRKLELQLNKILSLNHVKIISCNSSILNEQGVQIGFFKTKTFHQDILFQLLKMNPFPHSSVFYEKIAALKVGGYNERCEKSIDFNFYLDLINKGYKFHGLTKNLLGFKLNSASWSKSDNCGLQLQYAMIGLINYYQLQANLEGILTTNKENWEKNRKIFKDWFFKNGYLQRFNAKKFFLEARHQFVNNNFKLFLTNIFKSFIQDKSFFLYSGVNFSYPNDVKKFIKYKEKYM